MNPTFSPFFHFILLPNLILLCSFNVVSAWSVPTNLLDSFFGLFLVEKLSARQKQPVAILVD